MPSFCCVGTCDSTTSTVLHHMFPKSKKVTEEWVRRIGRPYLKEVEFKRLRQCFRVCDKHFAVYCKVLDTPGVYLKRNSLPTVDLPGFRSTSNYKDCFYPSDVESESDENSNENRPVQVQPKRILLPSRTLETSAPPTTNFTLPRIIRVQSLKKPPAIPIIDLRDDTPSPEPKPVVIVEEILPDDVDESLGDTIDNDTRDICMVDETPQRICAVNKEPQTISLIDDEPPIICVTTTPQQSRDTQPTIQNPPQKRPPKFILSINMEYIMQPDLVVPEEKVIMDCILGIDIGTTSVKVCIMQIHSRQIMSQVSKDTQANVPSDQGIDGNKQDVPTIISALNTCIAKIHKPYLQRVMKIGICGQMHGIMFWNGRQSWERIEKENCLVRYDVVTNQVSHLYTWQDSRCNSKFLSELPNPDSHLNVYSGYGNATIFWMLKNRPQELAKYTCAGTIQDFAVAMLGNLEKPVMSDQNAASWGYFDCNSGTWNNDLFETCEGFPMRLLPVVKPAGKIVAQLEDQWHSVRRGTPIGVAMGDLQCSVLSTIQASDDAVINISTSAQMAFVDRSFKFQTAHSEPISNDSPIEHVPYFNGAYLAVAAAMNGGNSLATFVKMLQQWTKDLGFNVPQSRIWDTVISLGRQQNSESDLIVKPLCWSERHDPDVSASISNINIGNLELGKVFRAICHGLIANLYAMMGKDVLSTAGISRILANGSALTRNKVLQEEVYRLYQLPLVFICDGDAAKGAAMALESITSDNVDNNIDK